MRIEIANRADGSLEIEPRRGAAGQSSRRLARGTGLVVAAGVLLFLGAAGPSPTASEEQVAPARDATTVSATDQAPAHVVDLTARRQRVLSMSPDRYEHVLHNRERLAELSPAEQEKLRRLSRALEIAPDAEQLRYVMLRYHEWLRNLSLPQRSELLDLPPNERLAKIKAIRAEQYASIHAETAAGEPLSAADLAHVLKWYTGYLDAHQEQLLAAIPAERRKQIEQLDAAKRRKAILFLMVPRNPNSRAVIASLPPPTAAEISAMIDRLSPGAQASLREAGGVSQQAKLLRRWSQASVRHRWEAARLERPMSAIAVEELQHFFETGLSPQKREELLNLPPDKLQRELRRLFFLQPAHADPAFSVEPSASADEAPEPPAARVGEPKRAKARGNSERSHGHGKDGAP